MSSDQTIDDRWRWKLRAFFSADLIGSTACKVLQSETRTPDWAPQFKEFFSEFPTFVEAGYRSLPGHFPSCEPLQVWKFAGDEVLFHTELRRFPEVATHVFAFKRAVSAFPERWRKKEQRFRLKLKATGWLAGFPVTNTELPLPDGRIDYIGPSIDLGFRLATRATERKFILSAGMALMLLDAIPSGEHLCLYFDGREPLKGVIPYPIVWLDLRDGALDLEEELLNVTRVCEPAKLKRFLEGFFAEDHSIARPFIHDDDDPRHRSVPDDFDKARRELIRLEREAERRYTDIARENEPPPEGEPQPPAEPRLPPVPDEPSDESP